jgi:hypothetical protein
MRWMPADKSYDYAIVRVVPRVERGEFINAGIVLFCAELALLDARVALDEERLRALDPTADVASVRSHLEVIPRIAAGGADAGEIGRLTQRERFHWLVAPRSTVVQTSPVHTGRMTDPAAVMQHLFDTLVLNGPTPA